MTRGVGGEGGARGGRDPNAGGRGGSKGGGTGNAGERGTRSQQQDRRNLDAARRAGNAAPGVGANNNRGTLSQQQDRINQNRALARSNTAPGVGNYSDAMNDFNNVGQGFFDDPLGAIGRFFGSGFGVGEIDPSTQAPKSFLGRNTASWGVDPIGAALGIGGSFFGPAGTLVSGLYNRGKSIAGWQGPMIAFDGNQPVTGGFNMPSFGGSSGGVQTASMAIMAAIARSAATRPETRTFASPLRRSRSRPPRSRRTRTRSRGAKAIARSARRRRASGAGDELAPGPDRGSRGRLAHGRASAGYGR
jgi:hypothetical protein